MSALKLVNKKPLLNQEVVKSFIEGVVKTLSMMANTQVRALDPKQIELFKIDSEVAGVVGFATEKEKGLLVISFDKKSIIKIHNNMLSENETELTPSVVDVVGELANMVYGSAKTSLNQIGYQFQMSIPTIIHGSFQLTKKSISPTVVVPFEFDSNLKFNVTLSVE